MHLDAVQEYFTLVYGKLGDNLRNQGKRTSITIALHPTFDEYVPPVKPKFLRSILYRSLGLCLRDKFQGGFFKCCLYVKNIFLTKILRDYIISVSENIQEELYVNVTKTFRYVLICSVVKIDRQVARSWRPKTTLLKMWMNSLQFWLRLYDI